MQLKSTFLKFQHKMDFCMDCLLLEEAEGIPLGSYCPSKCRGSLYNGSDDSSESESETECNTDEEADLLQESIDNENFISITEEGNEDSESDDTEDINEILISENIRPDRIKRRAKKQPSKTPSLVTGRDEDCQIIDEDCQSIDDDCQIIDSDSDQMEDCENTDNDSGQEDCEINDNEDTDEEGCKDESSSSKEPLEANGDEIEVITLSSDDDSDEDDDSDKVCLLNQLQRTLATWPVVMFHIYEHVNLPKINRKFRNELPRLRQNSSRRKGAIDIDFLQKKHIKTSAREEARKFFREFMEKMSTAENPVLKVDLMYNEYLQDVPSQKRKAYPFDDYVSKRLKY